MVTIIGEAGSDGADIYQEVGFYDHQLWGDRRSLHMCIEQVQLHPLPQQWSQVAQVHPFCRMGDIHPPFAVVLINGDIYKGIIPRPYDATQVTAIHLWGVLEGFVFSG